MTQLVWLHVMFIPVMLEGILSRERSQPWSHHKLSDISMSSNGVGAAYRRFAGGLVRGLQCSVVEGGDVDGLGVRRRECKIQAVVGRAAGRILGGLAHAAGHGHQGCAPKSNSRPVCLASKVTGCFCSRSLMQTDNKSTK